MLPRSKGPLSLIPVKSGSQGARPLAEYEAAPHARLKRAIPLIGYVWPVQFGHFALGLSSVD